MPPAVRAELLHRCARSSNVEVFDQQPGHGALGHGREVWYFVKCIRCLDAHASGKRSRFGLIVGRTDRMSVIWQRRPHIPDHLLRFEQRDEGRITEGVKNQRLWTMFRYRRNAFDESFTVLQGRWIGKVCPTKVECKPIPVVRSDAAMTRTPRLARERMAASALLRCASRTKAACGSALGSTEHSGTPVKEDARPEIEVYACGLRKLNLRMNQSAVSTKAAG